MIRCLDRWQVGVAGLGRVAGTAMVCVMMASCSPMKFPDDAARLNQTASLIDEVKTFGKSLGIEATDALRRAANGGPTLSMLWLWMQREGTLALHGPVDIRLAIGLNVEKEAPRLEQVYRVDGYSVYFRQGNEFADPRSVATVGFAEEALVRRVKVILHEDLHGDVNFALPWEIEEGVVTPLCSLAAIEYFRHKGDEQSLASAAGAMAEERALSRDLLALVAFAEKSFATENVNAARQQILEKLGSLPHYRSQFRRQTRGQHTATVIEAKLSHDLAYYRYFDRIVALAERAPDLKTLIEDLKHLPGDATPALVDQRLSDLFAAYGSMSK